jgi:hypothetical protein
MLNIYQTDVERLSSIRDDDNDTLSHSSFSSHNTESTVYAENMPTVPPIIMGLSAVRMDVRICSAYAYNM